MQHDFNLIVQLLIEDGLLTKDQAVYAGKVTSKLHNKRALLDVIKELGYITEQDIRTSLKKNQGKIRIGDLLNGLGYLTKDHLEKALAFQKQGEEQKKLGDILIDHNYISEDNLTEIISLQMNIPIIDFISRDPEPELIGLAELEQFKAYGFLPFKTLESGAVQVAFSDPLDPQSINQAKRIFKTIEEGIIRKGELEEKFLQLQSDMESGQDELSSKFNVVDIANQIIESAFHQDTSDIHVQPLEDRVRVRFRQDGVMVHYKDYPSSIHAKLCSRFKIMCGADIAEKRRHQDGRLLFKHNGIKFDLRMSFFVTVYGEQIVMRLLKTQEQLLGIDEIGMLPNTLERFKEEILTIPSGVIMVTGPTGSGKSSTVYSCINHINKPDITIITAEDPVEYKINGVAQCSIKTNIGRTFEETLKHIVRQDPDVVVIGEIRDLFSAQTCIQTALTGHKVLTTFHTEDSIGALVRLLNMNIEPFLVSSTVVCVIAQRLLRRVCRDCAVPYHPDLSELRRLGTSHAEMADARFLKGRGCPKCRYTGYKGRIAVIEMLIPENMIRDAVLAKKTTHELREIGLEHAGLLTLFEDGLVKAAIGLTTLEEVLRALPRVSKPRPLSVIRRIVGV
ncbi:MAG: Flp pilus assembly complex ATPase component TadA [Desulfobacterales bacterium]|nr:Flp pilus assembly complex ATPase component TadA [Desulfobacterales bacterium]